MFLKRKKRASNDMDLVPLVDMMFTLVLFLLVASSFEKTSGIAVDLPKAETDSMPREGEKFKVIVDSANNIYLENGTNKVEQKALQGRLNKIAKEKPDTIIVIQGDEGTKHGKIVEVMDLAKKAKLKKIAILTDLILEDK